LLYKVKKDTAHYVELAHSESVECCFLIKAGNIGL